MILTVLVMTLVLGPLIALYSKLASSIDEHIVGRPGFLYEVAAMIVIALVAVVLRLYFDLVEVYTVQLGLQLLPNGRPDRRVRKTLMPAFRTLRRNFGPAYLSFILLAALGWLAIILTARTALHSLAQPRVWPMFLLAQTGLFLMLLTRFWQRGFETTLSLNEPMYEAPVVRTTFAPREPSRASFVTSDQTTPQSTSVLGHIPVPVPDPEPVTPSLLNPDPGIYHPGSTPVRTHPVNPDPDPSDL